MKACNQQEFCSPSENSDTLGLVLVVGERRTSLLYMRKLSYSSPASASTIGISGIMGTARENIVTTTIRILARIATVYETAGKGIMSRLYLCIPWNLYKQVSPNRLTGHGSVGLGCQIDGGISVRSPSHLVASTHFVAVCLRWLQVLNKQHSLLGVVNLHLLLRSNGF